MGSGGQTLNPDPKKLQRVVDRGDSCENGSQGRDFEGEQRSVNHVREAGSTCSSSSMPKSSDEVMEKP